MKPSQLLPLIIIPLTAQMQPHNFNAMIQAQSNAMNSALDNYNDAYQSQRNYEMLETPKSFDPSYSPMVSPKKEEALLTDIRDDLQSITIGRESLATEQRVSKSGYSWTVNDSLHSFTVYLSDDTNDTIESSYPVSFSPTEDILLCQSLDETGIVQNFFLLDLRNGRCEKSEPFGKSLSQYSLWNSDGTAIQIQYVAMLSSTESSREHIDITKLIALSRDQSHHRRHQ